MKQFVYLNTDIINSYLSQIYGGLPDHSQSSTETKVSEHNENHIQHESADLSAEAQLPLLLKGMLNLNDSILKDIQSVTQTTAGNEMISKVFHDNSYDLLYKHIKENKKILTKDDNVSAGEYVQINDICKLVDLDFLNDILSKDFYQVYTNSMKDYHKKDFLEIDFTKSNPTVKKANDLIRTQIDNEIKDIKFTQALIKFIKQILPSSKYIITDDYFIPINKKYLRESFTSLRYIYSGESFIFGQITGNISDIFPNNNLANTIMDNSDSTSNAIDDVLSSFDDITKSYFEFLNIKPHMKILNPISWYY